MKNVSTKILIILFVEHQISILQWFLRITWRWKFSFAITGINVHVYNILNQTSTWYLLPFLCWWHTALSLISTWWSNGSCTDLRLPGGHLGMDERTSPTAQPGKDWASCLPSHSNSTTWFYHPDRFINNYPIKLSQKSWGNFRWLAHFQRPHCKNCLILQVCIAQHQKDQALSYTARCTTSCPGPCHF